MLRKRTASSGLLGDLRGSVLIEFTLVAPFLIVLALGLFEFGRVLQQYHAVNKSVRDAARYLSRVPATCTGATGAIDNGSDVTAARNLALTGFTTAGATPIIAYWTDPNSVQVAVTCIDNGAGTYRGHSELPLVQVTARVTYQDLGFLNFLGLSAPVFQVAHQELNVGE